MWPLIVGLFVDIVKTLFGKWANKDPEKERLTTELGRAKENQEVLAAPSRSKSAVLDSMSADVEK